MARVPKYANNIPSCNLRPQKISLPILLPRRQHMVASLDPEIPRHHRKRVLLLRDESAPSWESLHLRQVHACAFQGHCLCHVICTRVAQLSKEKLAALDACLRRVCKPKKNGRLDVPKDVAEKWKMSGAHRRSLMKVLIECKGNRAAGLHVTNACMHMHYIHACMLIHGT